MAIVHSLKCTVPFSFVVPLAVTCDHSLSFVVTHCHSLSIVVTHCHSLYHSLSFVVQLVVIRCHSLSFVVTCCTTRSHSFSLVTRCTTRLSFYKRCFCSKELELVNNVKNVLENFGYYQRPGNVPDLFDSHKNKLMRFYVLI